MLDNPFLEKSMKLSLLVMLGFSLEVPDLELKLLIARDFIKRL